MSKIPIPSEKNDFLAGHVALMRSSLRHFTGRDLVDPRMSPDEAARYLFNAPFAVVSHDTSKDPIFNYANQTALSLFGMSWDDFTSLPSRLSAETLEQAERERLMEKVGSRGYVDNYSGVRIGRHGRRFVIQNAVVWNLIESPNKTPKGQAALIKDWKFL